MPIIPAGHQAAGPARACRRQVDVAVAHATGLEQRAGAVGGVLLPKAAMSISMPASGQAHLAAVALDAASPPASAEPPVRRARARRGSWKFHTRRSTPEVMSNNTSLDW